MNTKTKNVDNIQAVWTNMSATDRFALLGSSDEILDPADRAKLIKLLDKLGPQWRKSFH